ncbi:HAD family hydrolase [Photobacterium phosphoreum]|jgi:HAD superfamily hydrolase (TIGR01509 family)|uniref:HAD family hydrolase n=1 Tax=Photobacterium phosphoreum TaxID=659 RepID=UPI0007F88EB0|nr:HAD family phosphatase [Photobacterium phosphoreum]MCD9463694.1 HAD family phosphatase [Photobacterium phosphoreum]MCD9481170.1 HAD-IA family hydrolase [Photobacterium phosphoreum]MCD9481723.1 HAD-IA family hydrolase [Photobacterium phosphoreum]MCD9510092.1 HAD-IA family hydrolase [Photobacterium phosphoreum]OBU39618.1 phosphatase [Photobacterium phosphoreum]
MNYKAAIFDMDGLLLDTEQVCMTAFQQTCTEMDIPFKQDIYLSIIGRNQAGIKPIIEKGYGDLLDYSVFHPRWMQRYLAVVEHQAIPVKSGIIALLEWLQSQNIPMVVATSTHNVLAHKKLQLAGLAHYFSHITSGDEVINGKPAPEIYLLAAQRLHISPEQCLAFEDSNNGVKSAIAANMTVLQIIDLVEPDTDTRALGHHIFNTMDEALTFLKAV